jgi:hypothetical protein
MGKRGNLGIQTLLTIQVPAIKLGCFKSSFPIRLVDLPFEVIRCIGLPFVQKSKYFSSSKKLCFPRF